MLLALLPLLFGCYAKSFSASAAMVGTTVYEKQTLFKQDGYPNLANIGDVTVALTAYESYRVGDVSFYSSTTKDSTGSLGTTVVTEITAYYDTVFSLRMRVANYISTPIRIGNMYAGGYFGFNLPYPNFQCSLNGINATNYGSSLTDLQFVNGDEWLAITRLGGQQMFFGPTPTYVGPGPTIAVGDTGIYYATVQFTVRSRVRLTASSGYIFSVGLSESTVQAQVNEFVDLWLSRSGFMFGAGSSTFDLMNTVPVGYLYPQFVDPGTGTVDAIDKASQQAHEDAQQQMQQQQQQYDDFMKPATGDSFGGVTDIGNTVEGMAMGKFVESVTTDLINLVAKDPGPAVMTFPGFKLNVLGAEYEIWQAVDVDLTSLVGNYPVLVGALNTASLVLFSILFFRYVQKVFDDVFEGGSE